MRPSRLKAAALSAGLSILFLVVYGGCNWITAQRRDVGVFYFGWERTIPFLPLFILPYMSIDLFFIGAPFLCRSNNELRTFSKRIAAAILIAGVCFLLFPLRLALPRPHAEGWMGEIFNWFRGLDAPYNLVPSLHAALWLLLFDVYLRHTRGFVRLAVITWFGLIGLSPLFTLQHHVIDLLTGFALAGYCFYFFHEAGVTLPVTTSKRIGSYYATAAAVLVVLAFALWPTGALLLWPIITLSIVAAAYFQFGAQVFRKTNGKLPRSTRFVLGPYLIGEYMSLLYYRRQCEPWHEVASNVWIGRELNDREAGKAVSAGVCAALDLTAEFSEAKPFLAVSYRNIPILDLTGPSPEQLREMAAFIEAESSNGIVYVHCKIGYSRSAAAVAAYLYLSGQVDQIELALSMIRHARPTVVIRPEVICSLLQLERPLFSSLRA